MGAAVLQLAPAQSPQLRLPGRVWGSYRVEVFPFRKPVLVTDNPETDQLEVLLERVALGSEHAFGQLYEELGSMVYGLVLRVVRDPAISEEVTQEIFLELWKTAPTFDRERGKVRSWAATIAHRRAVDRVRSVESSRRRDSADYETKELVSPSPEDSVQRSFEGERVRRELDNLTEAQRESITLAYYNGLTYREVAALLDLPEGTVKTRIRDGMIRLRDSFGVNDEH